MLKRALTAGLLALTLGAGLLFTPSTADAQRWRRELPFGGYFLDQLTGRDYYWNDSRYYDGRYYDPYYRSGYRYDYPRPGQFYGGYFETHYDPYYGRYYYFDPYTGQSYWY